MRSPLFRPELAQHRQAQWLGSIRLARRPSFAWVTGVSVGLAMLLLAFGVWAEVTRKTTVPGLLLPVGGLILVALARRRSSLQAEERQALAELETAAQRVRLALRNLQRYQELAASGYVSTVQAQQKQEEWLDMQTRLGNAQRSVQALQRDQQVLLDEQQARAASAKTSQVQMIGRREQNRFGALSAYIRTVEELRAVRRQPLRHADPLQAPFARGRDSLDDRQLGAVFTGPQKRSFLERKWPQELRSLTIRMGLK
ncbi:MAG: hypothetical protein JNJ71_07365 [Rubrivivax sp.]|nr:hypothetical protein [Rubrivivax sp.]